MVRQIRAQKTLETTRKPREYKLKSDIGLHDQSTDYFVAEPLTTPSVSLYPTSPKSSLILALSVVLGGFFGAALVLIRKAIT